MVLPDLSFPNLFGVSANAKLQYKIDERRRGGVVMNAAMITNGDILIVDDTDINVDVLTALLERAGYQPRSAVNGPQALDIIQQQPPELILLDINMPKMSGYEVAERLKADPATADIPIIFISALSESDDVVRAFESGGLDYIVKPFRNREVLARVKAHLQLYRQRQEILHLREHDDHQHQLLDKMRQQFVASATHDLKNPLYLISGYSELLQTTPQLMEDEEVQSYLSVIQRSVQKMNFLVQDMLSYLQIETSPDVNLEAVPISAFVREEAAQQALTAQEKQLEYVVHVPEDDATLMLDKVMMSRMLENLISNAIKYTEVGGTITISVELGSDYGLISVSDTGLGIPPEYLDSVFMPFERVHTEQHLAVAGTGLGLSTVKTLVERHQGEIEVESELGVGSTFRVILPR